MNSKTLLPILISTIFLCPIATAEEKSARADNGRTVILKDNGEWQYASEDIYATTKDGQRVKLSPNNKWQMVEKAKLERSTQGQAIDSDSATLANGTTIQLDELHIENKREDVGKNKRLRSNLVAYLKIDGSAKMPSPAQIKLQDGRARDYPVFSVTRGVASIGGQPRIVVRAKGAPRWRGVRFFSLQIAPDTLGNKEQIELRKAMRDVQRKEVNELPDADE